ncbi:MAG: prepilin-type N-terminal cleavage/methylation domain-containing protein [Planctomycetota bacterium]
MILPLSRERRQSSRGMTLIEIMLALFLFGLLAAFEVQVMGSVLNLWSAGERRGRGDLVFAAAVEQFRGDLRAMHTGPRGWMVLDTWTVPGTKEGEVPWSLPRLRFLADGASMPEVDPSGRSAVEVMWAMIPEDSSGSRFGKLVRFAQVEDPTTTLQDGGIATGLLRSGTGLVVMDGVLWTEMAVQDDRAQRTTRHTVEAYTPFDFPSRLDLSVEMVTGNSRKHPPLLDDGIDAEDAKVRLRGTAPVDMPDYALVEQEWVRVSGIFPNLNFTKRGERASMPAPHVARSEVYFPVVYASENPLAAGGRRLP